MSLKKPVILQLDPNTATVAEVQNKMRPLAATMGVYCPCCQQLVMIKDKRITPAMAYVLILLHRHFQTGFTGWLDVGNYLSNMAGIGHFIKGGEWPKLEYWGLIVEKPKPKPTQSDQSRWSGLYQITERGHQFALGKIKVPTTIRLYNGKKIGFGKGAVTIQDCLGEDLKHEELLAGHLGGFVV